MSIHDALAAYKQDHDFDALLDAVREAPDYDEEPPSPWSSDHRGHIDVENGDFTDVVMAWHRGELTDDQYAQLSEAAAEG